MPQASRSPEEGSAGVMDVVISVLEGLSPRCVLGVAVPWFPWHLLRATPSVTRCFSPLVVVLLVEDGGDGFLLSELIAFSCAGFPAVICSCEDAGSVDGFWREAHLWLG